MSIEHGKLGPDLSPLPSLPDSSHSRLPFEIYETVIDKLERPVLPRAALVCNAWYPRSARNLYSFSIEIRTRASFHMLFKQLTTSPRVKRWLATTRELVIEEPTWGACFLCTVPLVFCRVMVSLQSLSLDCSPRARRWSLFASAISQCKSVVSLRLISFAYNDACQFRQIVLGLPALEELVLCNPGAQVKRLAGAHPFPSIVCSPDSRQPRLRRLCIDPIQWRTFVHELDWLSCSPICASVRDFEVRSFGGSSGSATSIDQLLRTFGPSLLHFSHVPLQVLGLHDDAVFVDLTHNVHVCNLTLGLQKPVGDLLRSWTLAVDELYTVLSTVHSYQINSVDLLINMDSELSAEELDSILKDLDTSRLQNILRRPYLDTPTRVKVKLYGQYKDQDEVRSVAPAVIALVQGILMSWHERSKVHIVVFAHDASLAVTTS